MQYVLLPVSIICTVIYVSIQNTVGKKYSKSISDSFLLIVAISAAALFGLAVLNGVPSLPSAYTVLFGAVFGAATALGMIGNITAMRIGPMSFTVLISFCSMVIPTFSGAVLWDEKVAPVQVFGVVLLLISLAMGVNPKSDKRFSIKWLALALMSFVSNGIIGVMQKMFQKSAHSGENGEFLVISFISCTLIMLIAYFVSDKKGERHTISFSVKKPFAVSAAGGLCLSLIHKMNLYLAGAMPSILFFPAINGSSILLSAVVSRVFFKEKLSKMQSASFAVGLIALLLIANITEIFV